MNCDMCIYISLKSFLSGIMISWSIFGVILWIPLKTVVWVFKLNFSLKVISEVSIVAIRSLKCGPTKGYARETSLTSCLQWLMRKQNFISPNSDWKSEFGSVMIKKNVNQAHSSWRSWQLDSRWIIWIKETQN